jgi:hypothetical protein
VYLSNPEQKFLIIMDILMKVYREIKTIPLGTEGDVLVITK